jgi:hypothetical protein
MYEQVTKQSNIRCFRQVHRVYRVLGSATGDEAGLFKHHRYMIYFGYSTGDEAECPIFSGVVGSAIDPLQGS